MTTKEILNLLDQYNNEINSSIIKDLIKDHQASKIKTKNLYNIYLGEVEIKDRKFDDPNKINNKLPHDYPGDIVDNISGYMFGNEIGYDVEKEKYPETEYQKISLALNDFHSANSLDDLDSETGDMMSICGYAARLLYVDKDGKERIMNIDPWEVMIITDPTTEEVVFAMIYYDIKLIQGDEKVTRTKVEWYDEKNINYFISTESGDYIPDPNETKNPQPHMFKYVPVIKFFNNKPQKGDFEKVQELINAYDRVQSDIQNEVEEFRLAYFAFYGAEPSPEVIAAARRSGAFYFPDGTDGKFLTKPLDQAVEFIKDHKTTLNENIYKFAKAVDMRDENFSGASMSGESRKWKLVPLENRAKTKERKFIKALRYQFKVLCSAWNVKEIPLKYEDLEFKFKRNLPVDLNYQAEATEKLRGNVSEKTRLGQLSIVQDVDKEIAQMKEDVDPIEDVVEE